MKITAKQLSDIYASINGNARHYTSPLWTPIVDGINKIIELETCHELALAQNVAVGSIGNYVFGSYQNIYKSLYMKPAPPPLTRAELLRHMLDNELSGLFLGEYLEHYVDGKWHTSIAAIDINDHANYRIIK